MTAESSRKPSTEPERSPVENARLLLPQLTAGQRAVVGALIAECERVSAERDARNGIEVGADEDDRCPRCHRLDMEAEHYCHGSDPLDAELDRIVAARAKPDASDDPQGEGWTKHNDYWFEHTSGVDVHLLAAHGPSEWYAMRNGEPLHDGFVPTAREAAALALGKPTVAREIDWDLIGDARILDGSDDGDRFARNPYKALRVTVVSMLRALVDELRRTGAIAGKDGGK